MAAIHKIRTQEELREALRRFCHAAWGSRQPGERSVFTIPVDQEHDADVILLDGITRLKQLEAFLAKIADGQRLYERSVYSVVCICCGKSALVQAGGTDHAVHEIWCLVTAARQLMPGEYSSSRFPDEKAQMRKHGNEADPRFAWLEPENLGKGLECNSEPLALDGESVK